MNITKKRQLIEQYSDVAVAAINSYLDTIYQITEKYFDENGNLLPFLTPDEKVQNQIKSLKKELTKYENVRQKILSKDFNLSLLEINYVALSFIYIKETFNKQIDNYQKSLEVIQKVINSLIDKESETLSFSENKE